MFKSNFLTVLSSVIIDAVIPFIFIGMIWSEVLEYIAVGIGVLALIGLFTGYFMKDRLPKSPWLKDLLLDLGFPYALTLSIAVAYYAGISDVASLLWIPAVFAVFIILGCVAKLKKA